MDDVLLHRIDLLIKNIDKVIEDVKQVTSKEFVSSVLNQILGENDNEI